MKSYLLMAAPSDQKMEFKQYDSFLAILPQGSQHPHTNQRLAFQNGLTSGLVRSNGAVSVVHGYLPALWSPAQMVWACFVSVQPIAYLGLIMVSGPILVLARKLHQSASCL
jgi:hypothetical protein